MKAASVGAPAGEWWWCDSCERRYWGEYPTCIYCSANCDRWKEGR